ncbi:MAG: hypothetical protein R2864_01260 [Syntrophotaleaceae bacterium]
MREHIERLPDVLPGQPICTHSFCGMMRGTISKGRCLSVRRRKPYRCSHLKQRLFRGLLAALQFLDAEKHIHYKQPLRQGEATLFIKHLIKKNLQSDSFKHFYLPFNVLKLLFRPTTRAWNLSSAPGQAKAESPHSSPKREPKKSLPSQQS